MCKEAGNGHAEGQVPQHCTQEQRFSQSRNSPALQASRAALKQQYQYKLKRPRHIINFHTKLPFKEVGEVI